MTDRLAKIAYTAYGLTTDFKNYQGLPMPTWEDLPLTIKQAWRNAARAAFGDAIDTLLDRAKELSEP